MSNDLRNELGRFAKAPSVYLTVQKFCKNCNAPLTLRNNRDIERRNYCSTHCRSKGTARTEAFNCRRPKSCETCNEPFVATKYTQKYCSLKCCSVAAERNYRARTATVEGFLRRLTRTNHRRSQLTTELLIKIYADQKGRCAISGVEMTTVANGGRINTNVSIDRIDSSRGYEPDNVQLVCRIVNLMKHNLSTAALVDWCRKITEFSRQ